MMYNRQDQAMTEKEMEDMLDEIFRKVFGDKW